MPRVPRKVGWFHYEDQGSGEPLVFLHPFGGSTRVWNDQATYFLDKGYRVIRIDMRSHGLSTGERDFFRDAQDALMAGIEDLRLHVLPDAGHLCWLNKPKEFNDAVYNFLR